MSEHHSFTTQSPSSNEDTDRIFKSQIRNKRRSEVPATSHTYAAKYLLSSLSTGTNANYPPPPPFPVYSTDFYNASNSSELPLLPPPPPPPNWSYLEGTRVSTQTPHHQKKKWSPVAESSAPIHHPYQKYPDPSPQQKERRHRKQPHELLSESQKKANHIASEQKRRQNIRIGFDQLIDIVPSLNHGNRSEALILQKSVDHIRHLISLKNELKSQVRDLQGTLGEINYEEDSSEDELIYAY